SRPPAAGDPAERVGDALTVLHALDALSPERREVLVHQFLEGRTVAETADALSIPPGTGKSRTFYALRELRVVPGDGIRAEAVASGPGTSPVPSASAAAPAARSTRGGGRGSRLTGRCASAAGTKRRRRGSWRTCWRTCRARPCSTARPTTASCSWPARWP